MGEFPDWVVALFGTLFGGAGLKLLEWFISKREREFQEYARIRDEQRKEIELLRTESRLKQEDSDRWREKYYALLNEHITLQSKFNNILGEAEDLRKKKEIRDVKTES
jgi:hypothetical protein